MKKECFSELIDHGHGKYTLFGRVLADTPGSAAAQEFQDLKKPATPLVLQSQGSFTVGVEGYRNVTLQPGTTKEVSVRDVGFNQLVAVAVTDTAPVARRQVVTQEACNSCHGSIALHGTFRQNVQYCVMCHNANWDDRARRPADKLPVESIHMKTMIHKIHTGEELESDFTIYGFGTPPPAINFNEVTYPGDRRNCEKCHIADTQQLPLPKGVLPSVAPRDYINPMPPTTAAICIITSALWSFNKASVASCCLRS